MQLRDITYINVGLGLLGPEQHETYEVGNTGYTTSNCRTTHLGMFVEKVQDHC